jgi:hypothetical protein
VGVVTEDVQLVALAVIELAVRQIVHPERTQEHRDELQVILRVVDPTWVCLELATILVGVGAGTGFPMARFLEEKRARLMAGPPAEG